MLPCPKVRVLNESKGLRIYRAKNVNNPRSASNNKIGQSINPDQLLIDLKENIGVDLSLGLPPGPNSGLTVKLV